MENAVKEEFNYFEAHEKELVEKYLDKFIILKDKDVKGYYDTFADAFSYASRNFEEGTFLIQQCLEERETQVFHSRAYL